MGDRMHHTNKTILKNGLIITEDEITTDHVVLIENRIIRGYFQIKGLP